MPATPFEEVQPTEFGKFNGLATLGGADPDNDGRYIWAGSKPGRHGEAGLRRRRRRFPGRIGSAKLQKPFCLFVSLVNPHDVYTYPGTWQKAGYKRDAFAGLGIELPPNYVDDLSKKPSVQKAYRDSFDKFSPFDPRNRTQEDTSTSTRISTS